LNRDFSVHFTCSFVRFEVYVFENFTKHSRPTTKPYLAQKRYGNSVLSVQMAPPSLRQMSFLFFSIVVTVCVLLLILANPQLKPTGINQAHWDGWR